MNVQMGITAFIYHATVRVVKTVPCNNGRKQSYHEVSISFSIDSGSNIASMHRYDVMCHCIKIYKMKTKKLSGTALCPLRSHRGSVREHQFQSRWM